MPNHCEQDLIISGPTADLAAFKDVAREGDDESELGFAHY